MTRDTFTHSTNSIELYQGSWCLARRSCWIIVNTLLPTVEKIQVPKIITLNHLSSKRIAVAEQIEGIIICKVFYRTINHLDSFTYNGNDKSFWIILSYSRWCISFLWPCIDAINHKQRYLPLLIGTVLEDAELQADPSETLLLLHKKHVFIMFFIRFTFLYYGILIHYQK